MTVLIDPPRWPAHGRLWSHLASDTSLDELHRFARRAGIPARGFEGDHYDVPAEMHDRMVDLGAVPVPGRDLLAALVAAGLRLPKRRGEKVLLSSVVEAAVTGDRGTRTRSHVDVVLSRLGPPTGVSRGGWVVVTDPAGRVLLVRREDDGRWDLPGGTVAATASSAPSDAVAAVVRERSGLHVPSGAARSLGYLRTRSEPGRPGDAVPPWEYSAVLHWALGRARPDTHQPTPAAEHTWLRASDAEGELGHRPLWPLVDRLIGGGP